ncbi:MAG: hypothetical protein HRT68_17105 [Flavobacteriaceae bacterium]|nr:hypothetical protein [Flavobacteriaceae bacterium]
MKRIVVIISFVFVLCTITAWSGGNTNSFRTTYSPPQEVFIRPGDTSKRFFGDLLVELILDTSGTYVNCKMYLSTQLVGVQTLTATDNKYKFDLQLAKYESAGKLTITLGQEPQISKVSGNFTYSVSSNNESFTFKGDLIAW